MHFIFKIFLIIIPLELLIHSFLEIVLTNKNQLNPLFDALLLSILSAYPLYLFVINPLKNQETFQQNQKLKAIIKSAKFSIITTDVLGTITSINSEAERILEYSPDELIGNYSPSIFHDIEEINAEAQVLSKEFNEEISGFKTFTCKANKDLYYEKEWTYISKGRKKTPILLSITALKDQDGTIVGYLGIGKDISKEKELEKKKEEEKNKLFHISRMSSLGELSAGVAHEINNPLTIVVANLELLKRDTTLLESSLKRMNSIENSISRISKIVSGLKKYSITSDNETLKSVEINKIIESSINLVDFKSKKNSVSIIKESNINNVYVFGNECELEQVFLNLINNSIDAISLLNEKWIKISMNINKETIIISVIDSGNGIDKHIDHKLFDPFFTTKEVGKGTGLGLSISKGIIEKHNGFLNLNKDVVNTCFEIRLPIFKK